MKYKKYPVRNGKRLVFYRKIFRRWYDPRGEVRKSYQLTGSPNIAISSKTIKIAFLGTWKTIYRMNKWDGGESNQ